MSWWAYIYLIILIAMHTFEQIKSFESWFDFIAESIELSFVCIFILAFYYPSIGHFFGYAIFIMLILGFMYQITHMIKGVMEYRRESESPYKKITLTIGVLLFVPIVAFGYILGLIVGLRNV